MSNERVLKDSGIATNQQTTVAQLKVRKAPSINFEPCIFFKSVRIPDHKRSIETPRRHELPVRTESNSLYQTRVARPYQHFRHSTSLIAYRFRSQAPTHENEANNNCARHSLLFVWKIARQDRILLQPAQTLPRSQVDSYSFCR